MQRPRMPIMNVDTKHWTYRGEWYKTHSDADKVYHRDFNRYLNYKGKVGK